MVENFTIKKLILRPHLLLYTAVDREYFTHKVCLLLVNHGIPKGIPRGIIIQGKKLLLVDAPPILLVIHSHSPMTYQLTAYPQAHSVRTSIVLVHMYTPAGRYHCSECMIVHMQVRYYIRSCIRIYICMHAHMHVHMYILPAGIHPLEEFTN